MNVVLRVDASSAIGTGHVRRCVALAQALQGQGDEVAFVTRDLGLDVRPIIAAAGIKRNATLPQPVGPLAEAQTPIPHAAWAQVSQDQDVADTLLALAAWAPAWRADLVVVDSYAFDAHWHTAIASALCCPIAAIDDLADRAMECDTLIDHTHADDHRAKYAAVARGKPRILGGPRFGLLSPAYAQASRYCFKDKLASIGVFMGGVDAGNYSCLVLEAIALAGFEGPVEVVTTSANPNLCALREAVVARPKTRLTLDLPDLAGFFARHDLQIGAGGSACWERCCMGAPALLCVVAPNQKAVAPALARDGVVALAADPCPPAMASDLSRLIGDAGLRRSLARKAAALVDGRGAQRVALALAASALKVRPANIADARLMFEWRNHPATRSVSVSRDPLDWNDHCAWLERALSSEAKAILIGEIGGRAVGVIRFDWGVQRCAQVSLYCDPELHGLGLGSGLLRAGEEAAQPAIIEAQVLEHNTASRKLFARNGYRQTGSTRWEKRRDMARSDATTPADPLPA